MRNSFFAFLILFSLHSFAQDWAPLKVTDTVRHYLAQSNHGSYYNFDYRPIQSVSVDTSFNDSLGLVKQMEKGFSIFKLYTGGFVSEDIIKGRILGDRIRFYHDSLVISTIDTFGFQLTFPLAYNVGQGFDFGRSLTHTLFAMCDSLYIDSIGNGQVDSVAHVSLTAYGQNGLVDSTHHFNMSYQISKRYGLLVTPDFTSLDSLFYYEAYFGLENQLQCNRMVDLAVGDEYHYYLDTSNFTTFNGNFILYSHYGYKVSILADSLVGTTRTLTIAEERSSGFPGQALSNNYNRSVFSFSYDTTGYCHAFKSCIINDSLLNISKSGSNVPFDIYGIDDSQTNFKFVKTRMYSNSIINYHTPVWPIKIDSLYYSPFYALKYLDYIGLTDVFYQNGFGGNGASSLEKTLAYVKKGSQTSGTPINFVTDLKEFRNEEQNFLIYPNPVTNLLTMHLDKEISSVVLMDLHGKKVASFENKKKLDVSDLADGIYFVKVETGGGVLTSKFIKH